MSRRTPLALLGAGVLVAGAAVAGPALTSAATSSNTIYIRGGVHVRPGKSILDNQHYTPATDRVRSGATVTIRNRSKTHDPHTFSLVRRSDLPRTPGQVNNCFSGPNSVCGKIAQAHGFPEGDGPPANPTVNVGAEGFDQAGDSIVLAPNQRSWRIHVTAARGTNLYYMCAIHPWMQGRLRVR